MRAYDAVAATRFGHSVRNPLIAGVVQPQRVKTGLPTVEDPQARLPISEETINVDVRASGMATVLLAIRVAIWGNAQTEESVELMPKNNYLRLESKTASTF